MSRSKIAFVLTGSVAAYKACEAISRLVQRGHQVRTVASAAALRFVGAATLEGLTGERVLSDLFEPGSALEHINLGRWADLVVVCPATANTLNRLSAGLADDLAGALFLAHDRKKPFLVAPAMNPNMWAHPATRASVARLTDWGVRFIAVGRGRTACGEVGDGRLAEPGAIVAEVEATLSRPARRLRVLVTSGGTSEPVDGVRVLSNTSTGRTGARIADHLSQAGHEVVLLRSASSIPAEGPARQETFVSFSDLDQALGRVLGAERFDAVVHGAAVSDFGIAQIEVAGGVYAPGTGKLPSTGAPALHLKLHPKLVDGLRARSANPGLAVVAFKLTRGAGSDEARAAVEDLFGHSGADLVVHNDLSERSGSEAFPSTLHFRDGRPSLACPTRTELASELERLLVEFAAPSSVPT